MHSRHFCQSTLTHWGRVTHICVSKRAITGSDNGLSPSRRQAIIWTNAGILLIGPSRTIFSENLIEIRTFSFMKMHLKMSSGKWWPCCLGLNVLILWGLFFSGTGISPFNCSRPVWFSSNGRQTTSFGNNLTEENLMGCFEKFLSCVNRLLIETSLSIARMEMVLSYLLHR